MSLSSEHMLVLMAYADGELEGAERAEAERLLATEADAARFVAQVGGLGDLVQLGHDERSAKTIATFDVADAVMSRVSSAGAVGVTSLAEAREKRASSKRGGGSRLKIGAGIAAALALAASVLVFAQHRDEETPMARSSPAVQAPGAPAQAGGGTGVEVSTVNSPGNSVSVFYLPSANELSTSVVVWVDETGEK
jgi:anti-sigma factor RsiW